MPQFQ